MKNVLIIGSTNWDILIKVPYIPAVGETILGGQLHLGCGGKGANQALSARRCGAQVGFITSIGDDAFGKMACDLFAKENIATDHIKVNANQATGLAEIMVDKNGNNLIAVAPEANLLLTPEVIEAFREAIESCDILLLQMEIPLESILLSIEIAHAAGKIIILNPAPAQVIPERYLAFLDFITPNETEAKILSGIAADDDQSREAIAQWFLDRGVKNVIITLGTQGVFAANAQKQKLYPGFKVNAVDTTGAGDTFNGALVAALAAGQELASAIHFAQKAAAIMVTRLGTQHAPSLVEVENFERSI